ncbi:MAG TPA: TRAP transporter large permease [Candidatus Methylomirabilis sp.]|nr:TRAP transporter large permease [Candidatus Methylomirabilis sp.]HSB82528.1 TRAP transporter large permease [Candidatus Methylomirabilis sp.]HSC70341.1 TRAP transporter large permease [Candidatus Methylomirabilis sp.]
MLTVLGTVFALSVLIGVPIAMGLGLAATGGILAWGKVPLYLIPQRMFTGVDSFVLMAIPFFMLAGELMDSTGILERLLKFADALVGHIRGGIAHVNVVAGMILSGVSGSAVADASAIGSALLPVMRKEYSIDFGAGVVAGAAALGPIIPPSIPMIIYAASTSGMSVAALFLSGMIPGLMIGLGMMVIIYVLARKRDYPVRTVRMTAREFWARTKRAIPALIMPIVVLGGILGGAFTATEAGAVAVMYALLVGLFLTKELHLRDIPPALLKAGITTSVVFLLIATANGVSWLLTTQQVPALISAHLKSISHSPMVFLIVVNLFLLLVGCLMETAAALIMLVPILAPIAASFGIHPLHFGFVVVMNLVVGLVTPPVGVVLFVVCGLADISLERVVRAVWPHLIWQLVVLALVTYFPELTLWVPRLFGYE